MKVSNVSCLIMEAVKNFDTVVPVHVVPSVVETHSDPLAHCATCVAKLDDCGVVGGGEQAAPRAHRQIDLCVVGSCSMS